MAFQLSPGVATSEIDLTTIVPSVSTTAGAFAGYFNWGPVNKVKLVTDEITLVKNYTGNIGPDSNSAINFFTAANFLAYGNNLLVVRTAGANAFNAGVTTGENVQIGNEDVFQYSYLNGNNNNQYGAWFARYPGTIGNSLSVSICDSNNFSTWTYAGYFPAAPGTSPYTAAAGGSNDEMHIIVVDSAGLITGTKGTVLETFPFVSKAIDATANGNSNYYKQVIFNQSQYIYAMDPVNYSSTNATWGKLAQNNNFAILAAPSTTALVGGTDDIGSDATTETGYALFANKEHYDISLVLTGAADITVQQYVIDNIATSRADCVAFISPPYSSVVNQSGNETTNIATWLTSLSRSSSYVVADSGWKYQYDKYSQVYRWVPLNGDIAGLCVNTDQVRDPWYSPAGFNRGAIKNCIRLAWNPNKTQRDVIYSSGVNPVVSFPGQGTVLFGDKTLQAKPSAFDRINVRRLFIVLEKAISKAAQFSLFEFNDTFTQAQFVSIVNPFLRDIQGRRGITDFKVVCDSTNNTPQVIDSNQFVGDIYIKPNRSINYIQLNFVAVATGVNFNTIVGAV
jgi:phage tail sheath protein FI